MPKRHVDHARGHGRTPVLATALGAAALAGLLAGPCRAADGSEACLRGVNLSGAEFGTVPGQAEVNYTYPQAGMIRHFADLGATAVRLPVLWERLQPALRGPLDPAEDARLSATVAAATAAGLTVIVDLHNFGSYRGHRLGSAEVPAEALADVWRRLAAEYGGPGRANADRVVLSLMNEPHDIPIRDWAAAANLAIAAIRATGARNLVLVAGGEYGGASRWLQDLPLGDNGRDMLAVRDPLDRFAFDVHQYLDADSSGTHAECDDPARALDGLDAVHGWLAANGRRAFLGEFASSDRPACVKALNAMVERVDADPRRWIGWTAWGAGPWWPPSYMFALQKPPKADSAQLRALARHFRAPDGAPARCDTARRAEGQGTPDPALPSVGELRR